MQPLVSKQVFAIEVVMKRLQDMNITKATIPVCLLALTLVMGSGCQDRPPLALISSDLTPPMVETWPETSATTLTTSEARTETDLPTTSQESQVSTSRVTLPDPAASIPATSTPPTEPISSEMTEPLTTEAPALLFYVRTSWEAHTSQTGAFTLWDNAVKTANAHGQSIYDDKGVLLYTAPPVPTPTIAPDLSSLPNTRYNWRLPLPPSYIQTAAQYDAHAYGPKDSKTIYLTFNAGYEYQQNSVKILDILAKHNVKAVFFLDGHYLYKNPATVRRMAAEGHLVGNHTRRHGDLVALLEAGAEDQALTQITGFEEQYRSITGANAPKIFRPPSSEWSERMLAFVQRQGYTTYMFSWTYKDWLVDQQPAPATALESMKRQVSPGNILMLHSVSNTNVAVLEDFIQYVQGQGYSFGLLPE